MKPTLKITLPLSTASKGKQFLLPKQTEGPEIKKDKKNSKAYRSIKLKTLSIYVPEIMEKFK